MFIVIQGYAERKVLLLIDAVRAVRAIHQAGVKQERAKIENAWRQVCVCVVCSGARVKQQPPVLSAVDLQPDARLTKKTCLPAKAGLYASAMSTEAFAMSLHADL